MSYKMLPPGDLYQIITNATATATGGSTRKVVNSWWYIANQLSTGGSFPTAAVYTAFLNTVWTGPTGVVNRLSTGYLGGALFAVVWEQNVIWTANSVALPGGTAGGARQPTTTAVCCTMRTPSRGRIYVGRKLLGPIPTADCTGEELNPGVQAAWQGVCNNFLTPLVVVFGGVTWTLTPVIFSQLYSAPSPGAVNLVGDLLSAVHVNLTLSSWRHRRERTVR